MPKFYATLEVRVEVEAKTEAKAKATIATCLAYFEYPGFEDGHMMVKATQQGF